MEIKQKSTKLAFINYLSKSNVKITGYNIDNEVVNGIKEISYGIPIKEFSGNRMISIEVYEEVK